MTITAPGIRRRSAPANNAGSDNQSDFVKAKFWLNICYYADEAETWVSLPMNIPLDSTRDSFASGDLKDAQLEWRAELLAEAQKLAPGESKLILGDEGLAVRLHHNAEPAPKDPAANKFRRTRPLNL